MYTEDIWVEKLTPYFRCIMGPTVRRELQHGLQLDIAVEASLSTLLIRGTIATSLNSNTGETPGVRSGPNVSLVVLFVH